MQNTWTVYVTYTGVAYNGHARDPLIHVNFNVQHVLMKKYVLSLDIVHILFSNCPEDVNAISLK